MSIDLSIMSTNDLLALRKEIDATISAKSGSANTDDKPKKPRANKDRPTVHGDWTKTVLENHGKESAEFKEFIAERVAAAKAGTLLYNAEQAMVKSGKKAVGDPMDEKDALRGAHAAFVAHYKKANMEEFQAFKTQWEADHPKSAPASVAASDSESEVVEGGEGGEVKPKKKRGPKPNAECTPEELAARKEKRAANKAKKAAEKATQEATPREESVMEAPEAVSETPVVEASQPVAEEEAEEEAPAEAEDVCDSLHPFTFKKINYLRFGHEEDGEKIWDEGNDLWLAKPDGSKGAYAGILLATGKIDNRPEILAAEPDIQ
jgi:hypothetical protein